MKQMRFSNGLLLSLLVIIGVIVGIAGCPYFSSIITKKDIYSMEERRARQIYNELKLIMAESAANSKVPIPNSTCFMQRDYSLFYIPSIPDLKSVATNTVILISKDKHLTLRANGVIELK